MAKKKYNPGTYSAEAKGIGQVKVNLTVDQDKITAVNLDLTNESKNIGQAAQNTIKNQILDAQSGDIDGVSGASLTTRAVKTAVNDALAKARGTERKINLHLKDGTYEASAVGHGGSLTVESKFDNNKIKAVKVVKQTESPHVADYVMKEIPREIVAQQTLGVDAVSGATITSDAVLEAVDRTIAKADGDPASWQKKPYHKQKNYDGKDLTTDLLIVGAGIAGLSTAAFALKNGLKNIVVLEKNDQVGGSFRYSAGGFALANSQKLSKMGFNDDLANVMAYVHKINDGHTRNGINKDFVKYLISRSGKTFDQIGDMIKQKPQAQQKFTAEPYLHGTYALGAQTADWLKDYILQQGGKIILSTTVKKLLMDNGKARGVVAESNGQQFMVTANNIVFASGGTSHGKEELMAKAMPSVANVDLYNEANVGNTGDAYDMLSKIGAVKDGEDVYKNGFPDFGQPLFITWMNQPNFGNSIIINEAGKRFTNETPFEPSNLSAALFEEGSKRYYVILDGKIIDPDFKKKLDHVAEAPKVVEKATNLDDLAKKISINGQQLKDTVAAYNRITETKRDPFGKQPENLQKFTGENGYYAVYMMPGSWGTMGGVKINQQMQVLKNDGGHFNNIFAAGEVATGDLFSEYYMGGFSLAYYSTEGRLIAEELSKK